MAPVSIMIISTVAGVKLSVGNGSSCRDPNTPRTPLSPNTKQIYVDLQVGGGDGAGEKVLIRAAMVSVAVSAWYL